MVTEVGGTDNTDANMKIYSDEFSVRSYLHLRVNTDNSRFHGYTPLRYLFVLVACPKLMPESLN